MLRAPLRLLSGVVFVIVSTATIAAGCGGGGSPRPERTTTTQAGPVPADRRTDAAPMAAPPAAAPAVGQAGGAGLADTAGPPASSDSAPAQTATSAAPMLIRTGEASIEVDSVELAVARVREIAQRLGGYVANVSIAAGRDTLRSATLQVKVPAERFDALLSGLQPLGRVETVSVEAQDVGEEYVDVSAQLANERRLEARLLALADRQSNRLADVLAVERELARVRGEIDRAEGRLRYLRAHAALSTLTVTVHAKAPLLGESPSANPIAEAFRQAWRNFVGAVAALIAISGAVLPIAVLVAVVAVLWRRWGRRFAPKTPRRPAASGYGVSTAVTRGDERPTSGAP